MEENRNVPKLPTYEEKLQWTQKKHYMRATVVKSWVPLLQLLLTTIGVLFLVSILARLVLLMWGN